MRYYEIPSDKINIFFLDGEKLEEATLTPMPRSNIFDRKISLRLPKNNPNILETGGNTYRVWAYLSFDKEGKCLIQCYRKKPRE